MKVDTFYKKEPHSSNTNRIFQEIYFQKETSKQEISRRLSLSLPTVAQSLKELYGMGIIEKNGYFDSTGGRKAQVISVAHQSKIAVGVSLLRERIMMTAMDLCGNPFKEKTIMIPLERSEEYYKAFGTAVNQFVDSLKCPDDKILGIGLAVQGLVSRDGQTIINGDILGYTGTDRSVFQKNIRLNCTLFHDTEVAAFAELWQYPDIQNAVYVALNKNLGGALIMGRQVYIGDGLNSCVLEHMRLIPGGRRCYCGQHGCLECYCSINSLEEDAGMDVDSFFEKLNAGDPHCAKVFDNFLDHLALAINNIRMVVDCEFILAGFLQPYLTEAHLQMLAEKVKRAGPFQDAAFSFRRGVHGPDAAARGAALVLISDYICGL